MLKRLIDFAMASILLVLLTPVLLASALAVVLDSGWPMFYSQVRIGRGFRPFRIYKIRSMTNGVGGPGVTAATDLRITRVGRILRRTKIDELPQLWNVIRGDMSLVGPRPEIPRYVEAFADRYQAVLTVRPGITDLASLEYRDEETILASTADPLKAYTALVLPAKLDLAEQYVRQHDVLLDLSILWRTLLVCIVPEKPQCPIRTFPNS